MNPSNRLIAATVLFVFVFVGPMPILAQNITGTVTKAEGVKGDEGELPIGAPLSNIQVTAHDAVNAQPVLSTVTGDDGIYNTGPVPIGDYRLRYLDLGRADPTGGGFIPKYHGTSFDDFCSSTVVSVVMGGTVVADEGLIFSGPRLIAVENSLVAGEVRDAESLAPLSGILVQVLRAHNGISIVTTMTREDGTYSLPFENARISDYRVRFVDPGHRYFPQFFGAAGNDDFCLGTVLSAFGESTGVDALMEVVPPEQVTQDLIDQLEILGLPVKVGAPLAKPLLRAVDLIIDGNLSNDAAVCAQLESFIRRVELQEGRGGLPPEEASELISLAQRVLDQLGCP